MKEDQQSALARTGEHLPQALRRAEIEGSFRRDPLVAALTARVGLAFRQIEDHWIVGDRGGNFGLRLRRRTGRDIRLGGRRAAERHHGNKKKRSERCGHAEPVQRHRCASEPSAVESPPVESRVGGNAFSGIAASGASLISIVSPAATSSKKAKGTRANRSSILTSL